jgi:hypothetical protein
MPNDNTIIAQVIARCWSDPNYKAAVLADPTEELRRAGLSLEPDEIVHVHESNINNRHFIIPPPPADPTLIPAGDTVPAMTHYSRPRDPSPMRGREAGAPPEGKKGGKKGGAKSGKKGGKKGGRNNPG